MVCVQTHLFAQVLSDDLMDLLQAALWGAAVEHLQGGCVLLRQEIVQSSQVLAHLNESPTVGTAQVTEALCRSSMHLPQN